MKRNMTKKIVTLAGDGIGPEIMAAGLEVLAAVAPKINFDYTVDAQHFGGAAIDVEGHPLPEATLATAKEADAILLAAIGGPQYNDAAVRPEQGLLALRKALGLFANIRPVQILKPSNTCHPLNQKLLKGLTLWLSVS